MIQYITPDRVANAIMQDKSFVGIYILVEGNNDYTFYRKFVNIEHCEVQNNFGKQNILDVISILKERGFSNAIGILENPDQIENIFYTDEHDVETTIFKSDALNSLIDHYCEKNKYDNFIKENSNCDIRDILLKLLVPLGYLKWANQLEGWGLLFKPKNVDGPELKIEDFIPVSTMKFSGVKKMIETVFNYSRGKVKVEVKEATTLNYVEALMKQVAVDDYQICNGHDIAYLFALALRKKISNYNSKAISPEQIEKDLVLAYDSIDFKKTKLYKSLILWQTLKNRSVFKI